MTSQGTDSVTNGPRRVGRPAAAESGVTRGEILRAARACFATYGYAATTTRMIGERAGNLSAAAIYHHFGKKHDLMLAVHRATQAAYYERVKAAVDGAET